MNHSLEQMLAFHCAPALAGLKPADLISCDPSRYPEIDEQLEHLEHALAPTGIRFCRVCCCRQRMLLLVYRQEIFEKHLRDQKISAFLKREGYPGGSAADVLAHLQKRLAKTESFPHEIGILLGYPLEDVEGFRRHRGKNYKLSGYWKVYGDEERAREHFARYTRCRNALCRILERGGTLTQLFRAA